MTQKIIGPAGSRRRHRTFVWCLLAAIAVGLFAIAGASGTAPETAGLFELDKNATNDLTTVHVGVLKGNVSASATSIDVCELASAPASGATLLIDGEQMTLGTPGAISTKTGGCSFTDPALSAVDVRTYPVTRGQNTTTAASHSGGSDVTQLISESKPGIDWNQVYDRVNGSSAQNPCSDLPGVVACDWLDDPPGQTIFTQGSADVLDLNQWHWTNSSVPDADEILHAYAAKIVPTGAGAHQFLYFGADRYAVNGAKDMGFWFFRDQNVQAKSDGTFVNADTGDPAMHHQGDILLLGTFTQGGGVTSIRVYQWVGSGGSDGSLNVGGDFGDCVPGGGSDGCNTVNNTTIPSPWAYVGKNAAASNVIYGGGFMEGGIDLTALHLEGCFASFMAETRSSPSLTAAQKDFTIGRFESCGSSLTTTPQLGAGGSLTPDSNSNNLVEASIGTGTVSVRDSAALNISGTSTYTGTLAFFICGPIATGTCSTGGVAAGSSTVTTNGTYPSTAVTLTSVGRYCWRSTFTSGTTGVPNASDSSAESASGTGECFEVLPVTPLLDTQAVASSVNFGQAVQDNATLSGTATQPGTNGGNATYPTINATNGAAAGGKITFTLLGPNDCSTVASGGTGTNPQDYTPISGDNTYGPVSYTPASPGTYHWKAQYVPATGDPNNVGSTHNGSCTDTDEDVVVSQVPSSITTRQFVFPQDKAVVTASAGGNLAGSVSFKLYDTSANCTANGATGLLYSEGPLAVSGASPQAKTTNNTTYRITAGTTVYWRVTYTSTNQAQLGSSSVCTESTTVSYAGNDGTITIP